MSRHEIPATQRRDWRMLTYGAALLAPEAVLFVAWPRLAANLFATGFAEQMFMPHGMCYLWVPLLYFMHVSSDLLIGLSYVAISSTLIYLIYRARHDIPFSWVFLAFGVIHHRLQRYPLHGSVDDLARDLLARRVCQTPDRGGFGGNRRGATFPRSQSFNADSSRETLRGAKGAIGESPPWGWRKPVTRGFALGATDFLTGGDCRERKTYAPPFPVSLIYPAGSWLSPRRVIGKAEWHPGLSARRDEEGATCGVEN